MLSSQEYKHYAKYKNLDNQIFHIKLRIKTLEMEKEKMIKLSGPGEVRTQTYDTRAGSAGSYYISVQDLYDDLAKILKELKEWRQELKILINKKDDLEDFLARETTKVERKVFYYRDIEGMSLKEISEELGYSYQYIREVSTKLDKNIKKFLK